MRTQHRSRRAQRAASGCVFVGVFLLGWMALGVLPGCGGGGGGSSSPSSEIDPTEAFSGGDTTAFFESEFGLASAFSAPAANLVVPRIDTFFAGNAFFDTTWVTAPASTVARDGLGPVFNARACVSCHPRDGRGRPPENGAESLSLLLRLSIPGTNANGEPLPDPTYGGQLQTQALTGFAGLVPEGRIDLTYEDVPGTYGDGTPYTLRRPRVAIADLGYGAMHPDLRISPRVGPAIIGLGLLQSIPDASILALEDPADLDGDGISGRANRVWNRELGVEQLGRFGWKANQPTLREQTADAFNGDIGMTTSINPDQPCTPAQAVCDSIPNGGDPEISENILEFVTFYMHTVAVPGRRNPTDPTVLRGRKLFRDAGCAKCHIPTMTTGLNPDFPELSNQTIHPFTDLLLHDMGPGLADGREDFLASGSEWRTPPLWGVGLIDEVNEHQFLLHDGRARGFAEAILWHGGEAEAAREFFRNLPKADRDALIAYLEDL